MKILSGVLSIMLILSSSLYSADIDLEDFGSEDIAAPLEQAGYPYSIDIRGDAIGKANFKKWYLDDQHVEYRDAEIEGSVVFYYDRCNAEGAALALGYDSTQLIWRLNPFFGETRFRNLEASLTFFSERLDGWLWRAQIGINLDADHTNISEYATYDGLLWGRYAYCNTIGLHAGFLAQTGMMIDRVYPIIGFDWTITNKWQLNVVYPVNMSLVYNWDKCWSLSIAGRTFDHRQRVGRNEPLSMGLWAYRARGLEGGVTYNCNDWMKANIHAGCAFGPKLTISDRHNSHKHHYKLESSGYFGGSLETKF